MVSAATGVAAVGAAAAWLVLGGTRCTPETCGYAVGSELRQLQTLQAIHFAQRGEYALTLVELEMLPVPEVTIELLHATSAPWSARATHAEMPGLSCVLWEGSVPVVPVTDGGRSAGEPARLYCDFPT